MNPGILQFFQPLKIAKVLFLAFVFLFVFGLFSVEIRDPDFWWHLKTGEYIVQHGEIPKTDPFAYTSLPKDPINPESKRIGFILSQYWLAQVFFFQVFTYAGLQGIIIMRALILTMIILLLFRSIQREGAGLYACIMLAVPAVIIFKTFTGERPQLFSFLLSLLLIFLLEGFRRAPAKTRYLLPVPFVMLLWANLHGEFILGIIIICGYITAELIKYATKRMGTHLPPGAIKYLVATGIFSLGFSLLNPNTYHVVPFLFEFESSLYKGMIVESLPPLTLLRTGFYEPQLITFFVLLGLLSALLVLNRKTLDLTDVLIALGLAFMSLYASRLIPFFTPVALIMIARYGLRVSGRIHVPQILLSLRKKSEGVVIAAGIIALIITINNADLFKKGIRENKYPEGAASFLREHRITGNMFNPYIWGGYLIWELHPEYRVFIDGRGLIEEIFFQEVKIMEAYPKKLAGLPEWKAQLKAYKINFIVTYSVGNFTGRLVPLIPALLNDPEWNLIYMDNVSLIFVRNVQENREIIQRFGLPKEWLWNEVAVEAALKAQSAGSNINYYITIGEAFLAKKSFDQSKEAFLKARKMDPHNTFVEKRLDLLRSYGY